MRGGNVGPCLYPFACASNGLQPFAQGGGGVQPSLAEAGLEGFQGVEGEAQLVPNANESLPLGRQGEPHDGVDHVAPREPGSWGPVPLNVFHGGSQVGQ